jgi:hypothetical protein
MANTSFNGPVRSQNGFQSISIDANTGAVTTTATLGVTSSVTNLTTTNLVFQDQNHPVTAAVNATATATAAQVVTGYITSTSVAAVTVTLPTGTLLGAALSAVAGTVMDLYVDNTAGANTVTIAVATNGILSAAAAAGSAGGAGLLTVPSGVTGLGCFRIMFSSATAYVFSRIA